MKTALSLITITMLFIFCNAYSQKKIKEYNCPIHSKNNTIIKQPVFEINDSIPKYIKANSQVVFEFSNINTFLYSITFKENQKDIISNGENNIDDITKILEPKEYEIIDYSISDFNIPQIKISNKAVISINKYEDTISDIDYKIVQKSKIVLNLQYEADNYYNKKKSELGLKIKEGDSLNFELSKIKDDSIYNKLNDSIIKINDSISALSHKIANIKSKKDKFLLETKDVDAHIKNFNNQLDEYLKKGNSLNLIVDYYHELLFLLFSNDDFKSIKNNKNNLLQRYFDKDTTTIDLLQECNTLLYDIEKKYNSLANSFNNMPNNDTIKQAFTLLTKFHNSIDKAKYKKLFNQIVKVYNAIDEKNWKYEYQTTDISDKTDNIFYKFEAKPCINNYTLTKKEIKYNYNFSIKGGIKIDFSAGIFYHINLQDDYYRFEKVTDSITKVVKQKNDNLFVPSVGGLFNIYLRSPSNVKLALNVGSGTNIEKIYYYLGFSLLLGKSERISVGGGAVGGSVSRISDEYNDITKLINKPIGDLPYEVPMQKKDPFQIGYYRYPI